jgi:hypothetical protein
MRAQRAVNAFLSQRPALSWNVRQAIPELNGLDEAVELGVLEYRLRRNQTLDLRKLLSSPQTWQLLRPILERTPATTPSPTKPTPTPDPTPGSPPIPAT